MAIRELDGMLQSGLNQAVDLMAVAAHNSFRFGGSNTVRIISADKEEMTNIAEFCYSMGDMSPLAARDGRFLMELVKEPCAMLVLGDKRKSDFNYDCGACGYRTCGEMNRAECVEALTANGPSCQFKNMNVNMATNAAAAMAWRLGLHCRVFSTLGMAAFALKVIDGVDFAVAVCVSVAKKDPFFDRHQYWTDEYWDEIFHKEFPTYTRGFIGAVEDEG
ncbi:MAG: DUF2148 domain-containing protein [Methanomicrobiales archaeon]|nr:DUF2148 domain-containing protein [Methanomicrobiales archaeon]